jgi:hypothetical protein
MRRDALLLKLGEREITDPAAVTKELARVSADPSKALEVQAALSSRVRGVPRVGPRSPCHTTISPDF